MRLYYTTTVRSEAEQKRADKSLGGYKSSSVVPNSMSSSLFSDISFNMIDNDIKEYIAVMLKNETGESVSDINLWFEYEENCISKLEVSAVQLFDGLIENIPNNQSQPYNAVFYEAVGEENAVNIGSLNIDGVVGLWFKRSLLQDIIKTQKSKDYLITHFGEEVSSKENISIRISYSTIYGGSIGEGNL